MGTKAQHYVWRGYLKRWNKENDHSGSIFVYRKKPIGTQPQLPDKPALLANVGFEKYYYDTTGFTQEDISLFTQLIDHMEKGMPVKITPIQELFSEANSKRDFIESVMCDYEDIDNRYKFLDSIIKNELSFYQDSTMQIARDVMRDEVMFSIITGECQRSYEELIDISLNAMTHIGDINLKHEFHRFFFMQYLRSPVRIEAQKEGFEKIKANSPDRLENKSTNFYANFITIFLAEIMSLNVSHNWHTWIERIENKTDTPFVTSDTPLINLTGRDLKDKSEFYYPLSPFVAMKLCIARKHGRFKENSNINIIADATDKIDFFNQQIVEHCKNEVFADRRNVLEEISNKRSGIF